MGFYQFIRSAITSAGTGVSDQAFARSQSQPLSTPIGTGLMVARPLSPVSRGYAIEQQFVPTVGLRGNGLALQGQMVFTPLAKPGNDK